MNDTVMCLTIGQCIVLAIIVTGTVGHYEVNKANNNTVSIGRTDEADSLKGASQKMWEKSLKTAYKALNSHFVQGLNNGGVDPKMFGTFVVQDAVYLEKQSVALMIAAQKKSSLKKFLTGTAIKYQGYANIMYKDWNLSGPSCVKLDSACAEYTQYKIKLAQDDDPMYSIVAMIPCLKLWPWIGGKVYGGKHGVYTKWVNENFNPKHVGYIKYEDMVDEWITRGLINEQRAMKIYMDCMEMEYLIFKQASK